MKRLIILSLALLIITLLNKACGDLPMPKNSLVRIQNRLTGKATFSISEDGDKESALVIKSWKLHLEHLGFSGNSQNGDQYYFSTDYNGCLVTDIAGDRTGSFVEFEVPRGTYHPFDVTFHTSGKDTLPALVIESVFHSPDLNDTLEVEFRFFKEHVSLPLRVNQNRSKQELHFKEGQINHINIGMDMNHLLDGPNQAAISKFLMQQPKGDEKIIVSPDHNKEVYTLLAKSVHQALYAVLKQ